VVGEVVFVFDGRAVLEAAVEPVGVVPDEPLEHRGACLGSGGEVFIVDELALSEAKNDSAIALSQSPTLPIDWVTPSSTQVSRNESAVY
jgi:hypothetical protein